MKEFTSVIREDLDVGMRNVEWAPVNSKPPTILQNMRSLGKGYGVQPIEALPTPIDLAAAGITIAHPFPQLIRGREVTLLCDATAIYKVNESTWALTLVDLYDAYASGAQNLTNGDFTGSAGSWTLGVGWSYASNSISHGAGLTGTAVQVAGSLALAFTTGHLYEVQFQMTVDPGALLATGTGIRVSVGSTSSNWYNATGSYRVILSAAGTLDFTIEASAAYSGSVDAVSVKEIKAATITSDVAWHFVDMGNKWLLFNATSVVFGIVNGYTRVESSVPVRTGCYHRGRVLLGGFTAASAVQGWTDLYNSGITKAQQRLAITGYNETFRDNVVSWSSIGGGDVFWIFYPFFGQYGFFGMTDSLWGTDIFTYGHEAYFDTIQRNEAGFMPMETQGRIRAMVPIDKHVIVYSNDGVHALTLASEPLPTYGLKRLKKFGIASRGAAAGNDEVQIMINTRGDLWVIDKGLNMRLLGFSEYLSPMLGKSINISYDESLDLFFISDGVVCYTWSTYGGFAGPDYQVPTSVVFIDGGSVAIEVPDLTLGDCVLCSDVYDFGLRSVKKIESLKVGVNNVALYAGVQYSAYVAIDYRYSTADAFVTSSWRALNREGVGYIGLCGVEFRFRVKWAWNPFVAAPSQKLSYITVEWKVNDKRTIRGIYSTPDAAAAAG